jgi:hypothetical protein
MWEFIARIWRERQRQKRAARLAVSAFRREAAEHPWPSKVIHAEEGRCIVEIPWGEFIPRYRDWFAVYDADGRVERLSFEQVKRYGVSCLPR